MQIEMPVFLGAQMAKWRRVCGSLTLAELLGKVRRRVTGKAFLLYRDGLELLFKTRNLLTNHAPIHASVGEVAISLVPEGTIAFHTWSGMRFEHAELQFILRMLRPGMTFFDIGGNTGIFSLAAGRKLHGTGSRIYCFEPSPWTFSVLEKNLAQNQLTNVRAIRVALSEDIGEASLYVNASLKDALNSLEAPSHTDADVVGQVSVQATTLEEFISEHQIPRVDVMKVDVEGAELRVFRGARGLLERADAPLILYEGYSWCTAGFHYHPVEIMWLLESHGYELFVLDPLAGKVRRRTAGESFDAMVVAVKPTHAGYADVFPDGAN
jgi:FkbM family methyltransferase